MAAATPPSRDRYAGFLRAFSLGVGDIGTRDADGYYYCVIDRKKDVILRGGFNVYHREVEDVRCAHPASSRVAVSAARG